MKSTEKQTFVRMLRKLDIHFIDYKDPQFIHSDGIEAGSKSSIYVGDSLDFHFDKNERFLGTSNSSINSFVKRTKK